MQKLTNFIVVFWEQKQYFVGGSSITKFCFVTLKIYLENIQYIQNIIASVGVKNVSFMSYSKLQEMKVLTDSMIFKPQKHTDIYIMLNLVVSLCARP